MRTNHKGQLKFGCVAERMRLARGCNKLTSLLRTEMRSIPKLPHWNSVQHACAVCIGVGYRERERERERERAKRSFSCVFLCTWCKHLGVAESREKYSIQVLCVRDFTRLCLFYYVMVSSCRLNVKPLTYTQTGVTFKSECTWKQRCRNHTLHSHILKQVCYFNQNPAGKTEAENILS